MEFVKSHGLGNDYIVMDPAKIPFALSPERVRLICDRNRGVGSDGILEVVPPQGADFAVRIHNPDGSEAEKSGNGLRIFAKYLHDHGYTDQTRFTIDTLGGRVTATIVLKSELSSIVRVDMGRATILREITRLSVDGQDLEVVAVSVGNPHCVSIVLDLSAIDLFHLGPLIENHPQFPRRTNVQFAQVLNRSEVRALIWERGAGHTLASGSSASAVVAACRDRGLVDGTVTVRMEGGDLKIAIDDAGEVELEGPAEEICAGALSAALKARLGRLEGA